MSVSENTMMLMTITNGDSRSVSPLTPSPSREMRGIRLFRAISRKLARRSQDDINFEEDSRSSSTDSSSSGRCSRTKKSTEGTSCSSAESGFRSVSPHHISSSSSDAGSDSQYTKPSKHTHSTSAESIRKVFQNLTVSARSRSCNNAKEVKRKNPKKTPPKKILRAPTAYTYVRGLSGLPTQRVPKATTTTTSTRAYNTNNNNCGCSIQYMAALNR